MSAGTFMTPRHVRARERIPLGEMARRLGLSAEELRAVEDVPLEHWAVGTLARYMRALGGALHVTVEQRGQTAELALGPERNDSSERQTRMADANQADSLGGAAAGMVSILHEGGR
jgi:hypothetical protein